MASFMSTLGPVVTKLIMQLGLGLVAIVIIVILFFGSRYFFAWRKKRKSFLINACVINPDGTFYMQQIGKFKTNGIDKMEFLHSTDTCPVINPAHIRNRCVILWRYAPSQFAVIPPELWGRMKPQDFKIDVINLQMKNFAFLEQRAAVSRWAYVKDLVQRYAPYISMVLCLIFAGVIIYFIMKTSLGMYNDVITARAADCARLIGGGSSVTPPA